MSYDKQKSKLKSMFALEESDEVFYTKMQKGLDDVRNGRVMPLNDVYAELDYSGAAEPPVRRSESH